MLTPWHDSIKRTGQLTVFPDPGLAKLRWKTAFDDAIREFNALAQLHSLGVTMAVSATPPNPKGFGGADVQFTAASGAIKFTSFDQEFTDTVDGERIHGLARQVALEDRRGRWIGKVFIYVPATPQIGVSRRVVGEPVKLVMAVHELIHACGLDNDEHSPLSAPDVFYDIPEVVEGPQPKDDRLRVRQVQMVPASQWSPLYKQFVPTLLHRFPAKRTRTTLMPPIFLDPRTVRLIQRNWQ